MTPGELARKKIVIFSHYATTGACEELRDWLVELKASKLVYVAFPFGRNNSGVIRVDQYVGGELTLSRQSLFRMRLPDPFGYLRDLLYALVYSLRFARGAEVFVAGDNLLTLAGCLTRRISQVHRVIYYMIDYTPVRYANRLLNALYYLVDRYASYHADAVWPLTADMIQGRFKSGRLDERRVRWYTVPYGSHPLNVRNDVAAWDRKHVVYMGDVVHSKGAELLVPMALELKKRVPGFRLTVIGGGRDVSKLRDEVRGAGLDPCVEVCGFVEKITDVIDRLAKAGVAIAPYYPFDANSFTFFSDPGKIKVYLGCGLPVVLTDVPPIAKEIDREGAGRIADYDAVEFAKAIVSVMQSEAYEDIRNRARMMGERFAWSHVLTSAFMRLEP